MQGTQVQCTIWKDSTCLWATKPICHNYWSPHTLEVCSATREATTMWRLSSTTRKSPLAVTKTQHSPKKKKKVIKNHLKTHDLKTRRNVKAPCFLKEFLILRCFKGLPWWSSGSVQFSRSVMSDSATPWTAAHQASLSLTNSWSLLKLMSIESVMPSNHLILHHPLLLPSVFPSIRVFSSESVRHIRWLKYWSFSFSISPIDREKWKQWQILFSWAPK